MKNILKNKKIMISLGILILLIVIIAIVLLFTKPKNENNETPNSVVEPDTNTPVATEETHIMYVSINPLVKLVFKEEYTICKDTTNQEYPCGEVLSEIIEYELINDDAKVIYDELNFIGITVEEALVALCNTAKDNNIIFESLEITTDSKNIDQEALMSYLQENSIYEDELIVYVNFEKDLDESIAESKNASEEDPNDDNEVENENDHSANIDNSNTPSNNDNASVENSNNNNNPTIDNTKNEDDNIKEDIPSENENNSEEINQPYDINLNDNVLYTVSGYPASDDFISWKIKDVCFNKTIRELKEISLNYNEEELEASNYYHDDYLFSKEEILTNGFTFINLFPDCQDTIPVSYQNITDNLKGWKLIEIANNSMSFKVISLDNRYSLNLYYKPFPYLEYNLTIPDPYSGGGRAPTSQILTESICEEYNLSCGKW